MEMPSDEFEQHRNALIATKLEKDKNLKETVRNVWYHITTRRYEFDVKQQEVQAIKQLTKADLLVLASALQMPRSGTSVCFSGMLCKVLLSDEYWTKEVVGLCHLSPSSGTAGGECAPRCLPQDRALEHIQSHPRDFSGIVGHSKRVAPQAGRHFALNQAVRAPIFVPYDLTRLVSATSHHGSHLPSSDRITNARNDRRHYDLTKRRRQQKFVPHIFQRAQVTATIIAFGTCCHHV